MWYGMMTCALPLILRFLVVMPSALKMLELLKNNDGIDDGAVTDDRKGPNTDAGGNLVKAELLAVDDDGVAGVGAAR